MQVGLLDVNRILDESPQGKRYSEELKGVVEGWKKQRDGLSTKLCAIRQRAEKLAPDAEARAATENQQRILELELRSIDERSRLDVEGHRERFRRRVLSDAQAATDAVAKERQLVLVLTLPGTAVAYAQAGADITDAVLARMTA